MKNKNWVSFRFESNVSFGLCDTEERWLEVKKKYLDYWKGYNILEANQSEYTDKDGNLLNNFGFRIEHTRSYTLAEFAKDNNMKL